MNENGKNMMVGVMRFADQIHEENERNKKQKIEDDALTDRVNQRVRENLKNFYERLDKNE